ncbi:hypothetical protein HSX11_04410 [Oxalobacteraceae bacterium]|nr:hypothetical protein [Oxalobacteraceae bacterium]
MNTHGYSHWVAAGGATAQQDRADSSTQRKQIEAHESCSQCLSLAQIAFAISSPILTVAASAFTFGPIAAPATVPACLRTVCVFQPRAPPLA